jgi:hypothetical protein
MNEHIRELAEEAGAETWSRPPMRAVAGLAFTDENLEKFAELIVRECARCVTQPTIQAAGQTDIAIQALQDVLANDMKAYFGVE